LNLHDKDRPKMGGRPTWLSKKAVIPPLDIWMTHDSQVEVRMFLPVQNNAHRRYHTIIQLSDVVQLLTDFDADPETTVLELFKSYKELAPDVLENKPIIHREPGVLITRKRARLE
jgi:hypothetical protein